MTSEPMWRTDYLDADELGPEHWMVYLSDQPTYVDAMRQAIAKRGWYEVHDVPSFGFGNAEDAAWAEGFLNNAAQERDDFKADALEMAADKAAMRTERDAYREALEMLITVSNAADARIEARAVLRRYPAGRRDADPAAKAEGE